jgi:hypothetical protein
MLSVLAFIVGRHACILWFYFFPEYYGSSACVEMGVNLLALLPNAKIPCVVVVAELCTCLRLCVCVCVCVFVFV